MSFTKGIWALTAHDGSSLTTVIAKMPWTKPSAMRLFWKFKAVNMVTLGATILVTHD
jgi:hypothetical protein